MVRRTFGTGHGDGICFIRATSDCGGQEEAWALVVGIVRRRLGVQLGWQWCDNRCVPISISDAASLVGVDARAVGATVVLLGDAETSRRAADCASESSRRLIG